MGLWRTVRRKASQIWAIEIVKKVVVTSGIVVACSIYYYPMMKTAFFPDRPKEIAALYDKENLYPIKVKRQRELEAQQKAAQLKAANS